MKQLILNCWPHLRTGALLIGIVLASCNRPASAIAMALILWSTKR